MEKKNNVCKVIVAGDGGVGKTTLVYSLKGEKKKTNMTKGVNIENLELCFGDSTKSNLVFWDLGGQPQFRFFQFDFFKSAHVILLVFDLNRFPSFHSIQKEWIPLVKENRELNNCIQILIGNKIDLGQTIDEEYIQDFVDQHDIPYIKISALEFTNIQKLKELITEELKEWYNRS